MIHFCRLYSSSIDKSVAPVGLDMLKQRIVLRKCLQSDDFWNGLPP